MKTRSTPCPLLSLLLMLVLAGGATASAQVVTNSADSGPGSLRSAITNAASGAVITFDPSLSGATITLSNTLTINTNLTIDASALPGGLQINGNGSVFFQIFNVASSITVFLNSLTITNAGDGGIDNFGILTLNNCTLSGNNALTGGGGIANVGTLTLNQCTLSGNSAALGGGIDNYGGALALTNTIVGGNSGGDIYNFATLTYGGSNLVQSVYNYAGYNGPAPLTNAPDLAPLGNYGGPTQTMPPLPGSPAIDAGSNDATNDFATDQRGLSRFEGPQVDIGAVEFQASPVITNADSGPGSLRYAIAYVTNNTTITFDPSLSGATITLSNTLTINTNLTIDASALPGGLQINGNGSVQIFNVASTDTVFLNSLTITNGYSSGGHGGGIFNGYGTLTLTNCILSGNGATYGGGIYNFAGTLTLTNCILSGNGAAWGGGIFSYAGTVTLNQCTLSGNSATDGGGGILNEDTLTLTNCTLSGNSAESDYGGGICNVGLLTLNQCTLSGNSGAIYCGGIYNGDQLTLNQCTLSGNTGGGIYNVGGTSMTNTIVAGNSGTDIASYSDFGVTYGGSNLVQSAYGYGFTGPAPLTNAPDLAPLGNYGGPTQTMPPLPGSPAIGAGSVAANTFSTDQRGYARTQNGLIDLGAVELQSPAANPPVLANIIVPAGGGNGLQFTFTNAPAADFTVLTATNVALALTNWTVLGEVQQVAPGQFQFTDPQPATNLMRFYRVRSP